MPNGLLLAYRSSRTPCSGIVATGDAGLRHSRTHPRTAVLAALPIGPRLLSGSAPGSARGWPRGQPPTPLRFPPGAPTVRCWPAPGGRPGAETPIDGVSCDAVPTERLAPPSSVREVLGPRRPSGWVLQKSGGRGPSGAVLHAVDYTEAPQNAALLPLERALDVAERPGTRLCSLCGAAQGAGPRAARLRPPR
ncbi:DUF6233 domain-containing protein [Streptomyces sp. NBC_00464]|uniref:DUF6233 domain-containing protein n=1 Tax=Streptomyces sp. NBC_00464 TaxID=2975751 RepID=UPI003FA689D9